MFFIEARVTSWDDIIIIHFYYIHFILRACLAFVLVSCLCCFFLFLSVLFNIILHLVVTYKRTPVPVHPITVKEPEVTVNNNNVSNVSTESRKRKKGKRETICTYTSNILFCFFFLYHRYNDATHTL